MIRIWSISFCVAALPLAVPLAPAHAEQRIALVIGNSAYESVSKLGNPENDAKLIGAILAKQGFEVLQHTNLGYKDMKRAIQDYTSRLEASGKDTVGLIFYAGHGLQSQGRNFLVPTDARIKKDGDIEIETIDADAMLSGVRFAGNKLNIIVLDACRNNPFQGSFRSLARGFARMDAPVGSLVAFATAPGSVAADGKEGNSPYSAALASALMEPGLKLEDVFKRVRSDVHAATKGTQVPWESSSVFGDFYFTASQDKPSGQSPGLGEGAKELAYWNSVKASTNPAELESYLKLYPNGTFAELVRLRLTALTKTTRSTTDIVTKPETDSTKKGPFDGAWEVEFKGPRCPRPHVVWVAMVEDGKISWPRGSGTIDAKGNIKMKGEPDENTESYFTGKMAGDSGQGTMQGFKKGNKGACAGAFTMVRRDVDAGAGPLNIGRFDGTWEIVTVQSAKCNKPKDDFVAMIEGGKVIWPRGRGNIDDKGNLQMTREPGEDSEQRFQGKVSSDSGSGTLQGYRQDGARGGCTGTFSMTRRQ